MKAMLKKYSSQGIATRYFPIVGVGNYVVLDKGSMDQLTRFRKVVEELKEEKCFVVNNQLYGCPNLVLLDDELIREFLTNEMDVSNKVIHIPNINRGFAMYNGERAMKARATYTKFFNTDNLATICQRLDRFIEKAINDFDRKYLHENRTEIYIKPYINEAIKYVMNIVLLGQDEEELESSMRISNAMYDNAKDFFNFSATPINYLTLGYVAKYNLLPECKRMCQMQSSIEQEIYAKYLQRLKEKPKEFCNILDCIIERNAELKAAGEPEMDKEEIIGHWMIFQQAGIDTTQSFGISMMQILAHNSEAQKHLQQNIDEMLKNKNGEDMRLDDYFNNETLDIYSKELMRLGSPNATLNIRLTKKDFKLCGLQIYKNTCILIPNQINMGSSRYYDDADQFDPNRMSKQNMKTLKRAAYLPFGFGRRICPGRVVGELIWKILLVKTLSKYNILVSPNSNDIRLFGGTYTYHNPQVILEKRALA